MIQKVHYRKKHTKKKGKGRRKNPTKNKSGPVPKIYFSRLVILPINLICPYTYNISISKRGMKNIPASIWALCFIQEDKSMEALKVVTFTGLS